MSSWTGLFLRRMGLTDLERMSSSSALLVDAGFCMSMAVMRLRNSEIAASGVVQPMAVAMLLKIPSKYFWPRGSMQQSMREIM